jgi:hypothetical protein
MSFNYGNTQMKRIVLILGICAFIGANGFGADVIDDF